MAQSTGRAVIVTGGARGLGRVMAEALLEDGYNLVISASRSPEEIEAMVSDNAQRFGEGRIAGRVADVTSEQDCADLVAFTEDRFGAPYGLVNNAGIGLSYLSPTFNVDPIKFWQAPVDAWRLLVDTNFNGVFLMTRAAVPAMIAAGQGGRIVNISTSLTTMIRGGFAPYGPIKAGLDAMTRVWSEDLKPHAIAVNVLVPGGASDTAFIPGHGSKRAGADGNLLPPSLMAPPIRWLFSDNAKGLTGARLNARLWDEADGDADHAAQAAREDTREIPHIL